MAVLMVVLLLTTLNNVSVLQDMLLTLLNAMVCKPALNMCNEYSSPIDINECSMFNPCEQMCTNTNGSYQCSCRNGFILKSDNSTCQGNRIYLWQAFVDQNIFLFSDLNECMQAALNGSSLCSANSECINTHGSYQCACVPGYDLTNGTCHSMLHFATYTVSFLLIGIEEEPTTPPQIVPNFAQDNTYTFTITSLDITVNPAVLCAYLVISSCLCSSSRQDNSCSE